MELSDRLHRLGDFRGVFARIQDLSRGLGKSRATAALRRYRTRIAGVSLLLFSAAAGIWAHDLAKTEAIDGWLKLHPPSHRIWRHALESRGYREITNAAQAQRASKTLPALVDDDEAVWLSTDGRWIAVFQRQTDGRSPSFFCLQCEMPPVGWTPGGRGWEAYDPVLKQADEASLRIKPPGKPRAMPPDPKELRY